MGNPMVDSDLTHIYGKRSKIECQNSMYKASDTHPGPRALRALPLKRKERVGHFPPISVRKLWKIQQYNSGARWSTGCAHSTTICH